MCIVGSPLLVFLADAAQDGCGAAGGGGLGAQPVECFGVAGDVGRLVEVEGAGQGLAVDDVGQFGGGEAQQVEHAVHGRVGTGRERQHLHGDRRVGGGLDQAVELVP